MFTPLTPLATTAPTAPLAAAAAAAAVCALPQKNWRAQKDGRLPILRFVPYNGKNQKDIRPYGRSSLAGTAFNHGKPVTLSKVGAAAEVSSLTL